MGFFIGPMTGSNSLPFECLEYSVFYQRTRGDNTLIKQLAEKLNHQSNIFDQALEGLVGLADQQGVGDDYVTGIYTEWRSLRDNVEQHAAHPNSSGSGEVKHQSIIFDLALDGIIELAERQGAGPEFLESFRAEWHELRNDIWRMAEITGSGTGN